MVTKGKYVVVRGKRIRYEAHYCIVPYCYLDLMIDDLDLSVDAVRAVSKRCRKKFKSAEVSSVKVLRLCNDTFEFKVVFRISDDERFAYESEVANGR